MSDDLESGNCSECGIAYALPKEFRAARRNDHKPFMCPNGHAQHYPQETEADKLNKRILFLLKELETAKTELASEKARADRNFNLAHALGKTS
jgi:hypothetical protein